MSLMFEPDRLTKSATRPATTATDQYGGGTPALSLEPQDASLALHMSPDLRSKIVAARLELAWIGHEDRGQYLQTERILLLREQVAELCRRLRRDPVKEWGSLMGVDPDRGDLGAKSAYAGSDMTLAKSVRLAKIEGSVPGLEILHGPAVSEDDRRLIMAARARLAETPKNKRESAVFEPVVLRALGAIKNLRPVIGEAAVLSLTKLLA